MEIIGDVTEARRTTRRDRAAQLLIGEAESRNDFVWCSGVVWNVDFLNIPTIW